MAKNVSGKKRWDSGAKVAEGTGSDELSELLLDALFSAKTGDLDPAEEFADLLVEAFKEGRGSLL